MKKFITILLVTLTVNSIVFAQETITKSIEVLRYEKLGIIEYQIDGNDETLTKEHKILLSSLGKDYLLVLDKKARIIYLLDNYINIEPGDFANAYVLLENATQDFFIASEKTISIYLNDEWEVGNTINLNEKNYLFSNEDINETYFLEGAGNTIDFIAKNIVKYESAPDNTYWYRSNTYGSFGIIKNGKVLDQNYTYSEDKGNLIVLIDDVETYYLEGYATIASLVIKPVKMYDDVINVLVDDILEDIEEEQSNNCLSGDCKDGWGKTKFENGYYEGFSKNGKRNGYGMYVWEGVGKYIGNWKADVQTGFGLYLPNNGDQYVGEYKEGKMNGRGYTAEGETWTYGVFTNGEVTTKYHFYNNEIETGCVAGDCKNKYGRYVFESGGAFTGFFENGHFVVGDYKSSNGDRYTGKFNSENQFEGMGRYFYKSGSYYGGEWKNGERNGKGFFINVEKENIIGEWSKGELIKSYN